MQALVYRSPLIMVLTLLVLSLLGIGRATQASETSDQVALTVQQGVQIGLLGSKSAVQWHWLSNQGYVDQSASAKALKFENSQRGSGFSVSFDAAPYRKTWFAVSTEFQSDHGGWVGPRYFLVRNDGSTFFDPAVTHPDCRPLDPLWVKCTIYGYVPDGVKSVTVDVVGFHANYSIRNFSISKAIINPDGYDSASGKANFDATMNLMKGKFFRANQVDWFDLASQGNGWIKSPSAFGWISALAWITSELPSDGHSYVKANPVVKDSRPNASSTHEVSGNVVSSLDSKTAYLKLVATPESSAERQSYSDQTRRQILALLQHGSTSWIVDLRGNTGGSLYEMLNAMSPLIGERRLGYFEYGDGSRAAFGLSANGSYISKVNDFDEKNVVAAIVPKLEELRLDTTMYVIVDRTCASACESLAIALGALPRVTIFGEATAGLATGNASYPLGRDFKLVLTECYIQDIQGKRIYPRVQPMIWLDGDKDAWISKVRARLSNSASPDTH